jgi:kynurenine formamidase
VDAAVGGSPSDGPPVRRERHGLDHGALHHELAAACLAGYLAAQGPWNQTQAQPPAPAAQADDPPPVKGWVKGKGWGWIWGKDDEVGALNAITPDTVRAALKLATTGKVYDLGVPYSRHSYKWPGHSPGEVLTFRSPEGIRRQGDFKPALDPQANPDRLAWHSCALFISDNVATQIDGLGHITAGADNHWYNGFTEADHGGDFGIRRCDGASIPPIITRGVLIDVAGLRGVEALPAHYRITAEDLQAALEKQQVRLRPGDTVLIRTGTLRYWGADGADHEKIRTHDSAGIDLNAARWLVEQQGAILVGSDTSGLEHSPGPMDKPAFIPVHKYLLIDQGVHIGEFHYLEELAKDRVYEFCYVCTVNKIKGTAAGFCLRPLALR